MVEKTYRMPTRKDGVPQTHSDIERMMLPLVVCTKKRDNLSALFTLLLLLLLPLRILISSLNLVVGRRLHCHVRKEEKTHRRQCTHTHPTIQYTARVPFSVTCHLGGKMFWNRRKEEEEVVVIPRLRVFWSLWHKHRGKWWWRWSKSLPGCWWHFWCHHPVLPWSLSSDSSFYWAMIIIIPFHLSTVLLLLLNHHASLFFLDTTHSHCDR